MMISVISDVHGSFYWFDKVMKKIAKSDIIINLGDFLYHGPRNPLPRDYSPKSLSEKAVNISNLFMIKGNCDSDVDEAVTKKHFEEKAFFFIDGLKILALHGDEVDSYDELAGIYPNYDIIMFGHIHVPVLEKIGNTVLFNPGSLSLPKQGYTNSFGILDTEKKFIEIFDFSNNILKQLNLN